MARDGDLKEEEEEEEGGERERERERERKERWESLLGKTDGSN